jgi:glucosylceramidase
MRGGPTDVSAFDPLQQWACTGRTNQHFKFTAVTGGYKVTVQSSGLQLDVLGGPTNKANGSDIVQYPYWGAANEIWKLVPTSDGYVNLVVKSSGACMDVRGISKADGAAVQQWACWGGANQRWKLVPVP